MTQRNLFSAAKTAASGAEPMTSGAANSEREALTREQFNSLTRLIPVLYAVLLFNTIMISWTFRYTASAWIILGLPALCLAFISTRLIFWLKLRGQSETLDLCVIKRAMRSTAIMGPGLTLLFTAIGLLLMRNGSSSEQSLAVLSIWVAASASAFCLYSLPTTAVLVVLSSCIPLCIAFLISGNAIMMMLTPVFATLSGLMIYMLRENFRAFAMIVNSRSKLEETRKLTEEAKVAAIEIANTDSLTGLANRRCFDRHLTAVAERLGFLQGGAFVVMLDLDGFKPINDAYGHGVGDVFLIEVARRLSATLGERGLVARMGGDEFAILVEGVSDTESATRVGLELASAIDRPFTHGAIIARMRASCGIAIHNGTGATARRMVERADIALYAAKRTARGGVIVFSDDLEDEARVRVQIEQGLRIALLEDTLEIHFQPIIEIKHGEIIGFEALARWDHPELGTIAPSVFIPVAEQIGVIDSLTNTLLLKAATYAATWPGDLILSFNLSANSIASPAASQNIISIVNAAGLAPHRLDVEVTESAFMLDVAAARASINALRKAGVKVSLDDFGTGYSSFSQLCDLPLDTLKIDKSFIDRICTDPNAANVVRAIIGMCDNLDLKCLAEGIEHSNQLELLEQLGCHAGQGYVISKPLSVSDVDTLLRTMQAHTNAEQKRVA